jgi:hypothetical protein
MSGTPDDKIQFAAELAAAVGEHAGELADLVRRVSDAERELIGRERPLSAIADLILQGGMQVVEHADADQLEALWFAVHFCQLHLVAMKTEAMLRQVADAQRDAKDMIGRRAKSN